jgi:hypothetical protein
VGRFDEIHRRSLSEPEAFRAPAILEEVSESLQQLGYARAGA